MGAKADLDIAAIRRQFPALERTVDGRPAVYFDGPAGSQVPRRVIDAVANYLSTSNANTHGRFATSRETDEVLAGARAAVAEFLGAGDPTEIVFGPNMTTLTFALARSLAAGWGPGDEIVVTRLDHDANVTPWVMAARDAGATVRMLGFRPDDTTLDLAELESLLGPRTRLVAVGAASNATGTVNPVAEIAARARAAGAEVFVDAVHYAPHRLIDVAAWKCDYLACSAYKFFGPHVGILWGRRARMDAVPVYKVRPAGELTPERWESGTGNHEGIAGTREAIEYLADLGRPAAAGAGAREDRREALVAAFDAVRAHEERLLSRLLEGLARLPEVTVWGIRDPARAAERAPTVSITHARRRPQEVAEELGRRGIFVWDGDYYAVEVVRALGLEPDGMVRIGLLHYNTADEVDRLLAELARL